MINLEKIKKTMYNIPVEYYIIFILVVVSIVIYNYNVKLNNKLEKDKINDLMENTEAN